MAYTTGMLNKRITIQNRIEATAGKFGLDGSGIEWEDTTCVWASVEWAKGMRAMNAGAPDAYAIVLVRMRWTPFVTMRSRIVHEGVTYQILPETFHPDHQANTIQFQAQAIIK